MTAPQAEVMSRPYLADGKRLRDHLAAGLERSGARARLEGPDDGYDLADLLSGQVLPGKTQAYAGRSILLVTHRQSAAAAALVALDGLAKRIVLCPPDFKLEHLEVVAAMGGIDMVIADHELGVETALPVHRLHPITRSLDWAEPTHWGRTEWALFTSGTTGLPKLVVHSLDGLTGAIRAGAPLTSTVVWATYYDIRRYGGLQILLRALLGGFSLGVTGHDEPVSDYLARLGVMGVTHLTGTPSHWRRALMSPQLQDIHPGYVRLSGEIADQAVLDRLKEAFPGAAIGHAYASTEAGVGFEVTDGLEGFPLAYLEREDGPVKMKLVDGVLHIQSARTAARYLGQGAPVLMDAEGFVNTDDIVEVREGRCYFAGRAAGVINVGGLKIHPEEVEAVINRHPAVDLSRVQSRKNPITGALVAAEVVLKPQWQAMAQAEPRMLKDEILSQCRQKLGPAKTPVSMSFVTSLPMTAGGKLERRKPVAANA
jgi:acyl-coenzyme A synthetase/AMP-(fatty) acid ligase